MHSVQTLSRIQCVTLCSTTDGCYAVNVIRNSDVNCELTTGLSDQTEMVDNPTSNLYVAGKYSYSQNEMIHDSTPNLRETHDASKL